MKSRKVLKIIFWSVFTLFFGVIFFTLLATIIIDRNAENRLYTEVDNVPENRVALLLGTTPITYFGKPSPTFNDRVNTAAELYRSGKVKYILASGSNRFLHLDETKAMRAALIERGVPEDRILLDTAGYRTSASIERAKTIFGFDSVTIVSQGSHNARALMYADKYDLNSVAICAPDTGRVVFPIRTILREWLARDKCLVEAIF